MDKDYKKLYEEALERAKRWASQPTVWSSDDICQKVFPELIESEDEKIRKSLIKGLSAMRDIYKHQTFSDDAININDAIAWLEKQGEKSIVWSEEDEHYKNGLIGLVEDSKAGLPINLRGKAADKCIYWLKSLKDRIHFNQKEWNEEDEKKIMWLVRLISTAGFRELDNDKMPCSRSELLDWLKSLKPNHWKPSEEQLIALKNVIIGKRGPLYELYFELENFEL